MRHLRLALPALALVAVGSWAPRATACDDKASAQSASATKSAACTASMAAQCTADQAAACRAKRARATAASAASCPSKASDVSVAYSHCSKSSAAAYAASENGCAGAKTSAASMASDQSCAAHHDKLSALGSGACTGRGMTASAARSAHGDCDACADMAIAYQELEAAGTRTQVVPLKNGVMFVYTAESPGHVSAVQTAMARRNERLAQIVSAGDKAHLCPECKEIRGAVASGRMTREVVNIEGGALTLMTSNDPALVAKIHAMVQNHKDGRYKI